MSTPEARCVWLTREQRDYLDWAKNHAFSHGLRNLSKEYEGIIAAWEAAPADPEQAVRSSFSRSGEYGNNVAKAVLVALGYPDGSPRQETPTESNDPPYGPGTAGSVS